MINVCSKSVRGNRGEQRRGRIHSNFPSVFAGDTPKHISNAWRSWTAEAALTHALIKAECQRHANTALLWGFS